MIKCKACDGLCIVDEYEDTTMEDYDSRKETIEHIQNVRNFLADICVRLTVRGEYHDQSKLSDEEKKVFDVYTPKLKNSTYGSDEYMMFLDRMKVALNHHYENNRHHPEHFKNGIKGMNLIDIIEMFCDWKAATMRHADGNLGRSIELNKKRFEYSDEVEQIFKNTVEYLLWNK